MEEKLTKADEELTNGQAEQELTDEQAEQAAGGGISYQILAQLAYRDSQQAIKQMKKS